MNTKLFGIKVGMAGLALALGGVGCGAEGDRSQAQEDDAASETTKLVHSIDAGNGHTVEFYDFGEGQVGIKELYKMGDKPLLDDASALETATLEDMFRHIRPSELVPAAIVAADAHAAVTLSKPQVIHATPLNVAAPPEVAKVQLAASSCSADQFNDSWSAQWFVDNFGSLWNYHCNGAFFVNVNHIENQALAQSSASGKYVWLWRGFEGDFNVGATFTVYRNGTGLPANVPITSGNIPPRNVMGMTISGGFNSQTNHADVKSPCGHGAIAQAWCD